jgi:serine/threonine-protein kinase RsbT
VAGEIRVSIHSEADIVAARQQGRALAAELGFSSGDLTLIATAISEVARNIVAYAKRGEILLSHTNQGSRRGIVVVARDEGPGIPDIAQAMQDGYSTSRGLGLGLPGAKRLMDEFDIASQAGKGTTIVMKKWAR